MITRFESDGPDKKSVGQVFSNLVTFLRFGIVGVVTALIYFGLLIGFVELDLLSVSFASAVAYVLAVLVNYCLHYFWAFGSQRGHSVAIRRYLVMVGTGFLINWAGMTFLATDTAGYSYLIIQMGVLTVVIAWNYLLSFTWVFR